MYDVLLISVSTPVSSVGWEDFPRPANLPSFREPTQLALAFLSRSPASGQTEGFPSLMWGHREFPRPRAPGHHAKSPDAGAGTGPSPGENRWRLLVHLAQPEFLADDRDRERVRGQKCFTQEGYPVTISLTLLQLSSPVTMKHLSLVCVFLLNPPQASALLSLGLDRFFVHCCASGPKAVLSMKWAILTYLWDEGMNS